MRALDMYVAWILKGVCCTCVGDGKDVCCTRGGDDKDVCCTCGGKDEDVCCTSSEDSEAAGGADVLFGGRDPPRDSLKRSSCSVKTKHEKKNYLL